MADRNMNCGWRKSLSGLQPPSAKPCARRPNKHKVEILNKVFPPCVIESQFLALWTLQIHSLKTKNTWTTHLPALQPDVKALLDAIKPLICSDLPMMPR